MVNHIAEDFLKERYFQPGEDWEKMCCRVADFHADTPEQFKDYYDVLVNCRGLPNSPTLMNSGLESGYLSACNLVPLPDDLEGIMEAVKSTAIIQKHGGGCCASGTIIPTHEFGFIPIENIPTFNDIPEDEQPYECTPFTVFSFDKHSSTFTHGTVTHLWRFKQDEYYRVHFGNHGMIEVTPWHKFLVWRKNNSLTFNKIIEKRADELSKNDYILTPSIFDRLFINDEPDFWWLYGYFLGNGSIDEGKQGVRLRFYDKKKDMLERVQSIFMRYTGSSGNLYTDDRGLSCVQITCVVDSKHGNANSEAQRFFKRVINLNSDITQSKQIPPLGFLCPNPFAFIAGLIDSDGYIGNGKSGISTKNREMAECISRHLSLIGVNSTIRERNNLESDNEIRGTWAEVTFPTSMTKLFPTVKQHRGERFTISRKTKIKKIEHIKEEKSFYDFTVDKYENYLAGSSSFIAVHNTGMNFSKLRPTGDIIQKTGGTSSGTVSFLRMFDVVGQVIKQGGKRRAANIGILKYDHPDVLRWLHAKDVDGELSTFNISIGLTDEFFDKLERNAEIVFINPRNGRPFPAYDPMIEADRPAMSANDLFHRITKSMWTNGEPGVLYWDTIQRGNTTPSMGNIQGVNPCITGDTLIAVADGRGQVPIRELAEDGKQVPVYSFNGERIVVETAVAPRKTGYDIEVYRVTFNDGSSLDVTANHRMMLRTGEYVRVDKLNKGDSLMPFNRCEYSPKRKSTKYWAVSTNEREQRWLPEHKMIAEYYNRDSDIISQHCNFDEQDDRKVLSIEYIGKQDVFNLTVPRYNNYAVVTNLESTTRQTGVIIRNCGETGLYYWESCCLASVNLMEHIKKTNDRWVIDYMKLSKTIRTLVQLLNSIIDKNNYPLPQMERAAKETRKIGLGMMGLADVLAMMGITYGSDEAIKVTREIISYLQSTGLNESIRLKDIDGIYPAWQTGDGLPRRNGTITSIAPTGSISFIAGVSSGIEPFFSMAYQMNREGKPPAIVVAQSFKKQLEEDGLEDILSEMISTGKTPRTLVKEGKLPEKYNVFITASEISPQDHVRMQVTVQEHVEMSISKTINMPNEATIEDVKSIIIQGFVTGCKGMTIFRDGCFRDAFLSDVTCENCGSVNIDHKEGCMTCKDCGTSVCVVG
ncbi:MAG: hypothetical protein GF411_02950 [Candidatus Lokiarchaeota archaeon]|nr:hypothetical protein [Candidatus Lokiarchaeota archaeon]